MRTILYHLLGIMLLSVSGQAQNVPSLALPYSPTDIKGVMDNLSQESIFFNDLVSFSARPDGSVRENTLTALSPSDFRLDSLYYVLSLRTNPFATATDLVGKNFEVVLEYQLVYFSGTTGLDSTEVKELRVDYDAVAGGTYTAKAYDLLPEMPYVRLKPIRITITDRNTGIPATDFTPFDNLIEIRQNLIQKRVYQPIVLSAPTNRAISLTSDNGYLRLSWAAQDWATSYIVEYLFVENISPSLTLIDPVNIPYDFRLNGTRVEVPAQPGLQEYLIPNVFDPGYVLFRVRGVGEWGTNPPQKIQSNWSLPDSGPSLPGAPGTLSLEVISTFFTTHEGWTMNWEHRTQFGAKGRRSDQLIYRDGTFRERQVSQAIYSDQQILTSEQVYDHAGRMAIEFLPSPHDPNGASTDPPALDYFPEFNLDGSGATFGPASFEYTNTTCTDIFPGGANDVDPSTGAGLYYSGSNPNKSEERAYIPDALGYPYRQTEYTDDQTNRVRRRGGFGETFQLGTGHEIKYYHVSPTQNELDRVFGLDVGNARHYRKEVIIDANGQTVIRYYNPENNVIATALAGESPDALDPLDNQQMQTINFDLFSGFSQLDPISNSLTSKTSIYLSGEPGSLQPVTINYTVSNTNFTADACPNLCFNCVYDLRLLVRRDCGTTVLDTSLTVGSIEDILACEGVNLVFNTNNDLETGEYIFTKKLTVNQAAINAATEAFLASCVDLDIPVDTPGVCAPVDCDACPPIESLYINYGNVDYDYQDGGSGTVTLPTLFPPLTDPDCSEFCLSSLPNLLETTLTMLLSDVSPGGQYGQYLDTTRTGDDPRGLVDPTIFPLSVFNSRDVTSGLFPFNQLPFVNANWRHPAGGVYRNPDGSPSWVPIPLAPDGSLETSFYSDTATVQFFDGVAMVRPQAINRVSDFIEVWQPSWAYALVVYHPEYPYYIYSRDFFNSYETEAAVQRTALYAEAKIEYPDLTDTNTANDFSGDDFLDGIVGARTAYQALAEQYIRKAAFDPDLAKDYNIVEAASMVVHCGNPLFSAAEALSCVTLNPLYTNLNPEVLNAEWQVYRAMAIEVRQKVLQDFRQNWIEENGFFSNDLINNPREPLYEEKKKRFPTQDDIKNFFPDENGNDFTDDPEEFRNYYTWRERQACEACPGVNGLTALINGLFNQKRFQMTTSLPSAPNLVFPAALIDVLGVTTSDPVIWDVQSAGSFNQDVDILINGSTTPAANMYFETDLLPFDEIQYITCIRVLDNTSGFNFFATGYSESLDSTSIQGFVNGIPLQACGVPIPCRNTDLADDMKVFLEYIFQNNLYDASSEDLYNPFSFNPALTDELEQVLVDNGINDWRWELFDINPAGTALLVDWRFGLSGGGTDTRIFDFTISDPSFDIRDVEEILSIRKNPGATTGDPLSSFTMIVRDINGFEFAVDIETTNPYFRVFNCDPPPTEVTNSEAFCCIRPIRLEPGPTCEDIFADIAEGSRRLREQAILDSLRNKFQSEYIAHCLDAMESYQTEYQEKLYHYTLYYYDAAQNLVQTVPPKGVDYLSDANVIQTRLDRFNGWTAAPLTNHTMVATNTYNSLDQPIRKTHPDEGTMRYAYDETGRLILSQDAVQDQEKEASYLAYDELGRMVQSGVVDYDLVLPSEIPYATFEALLSSPDRREITDMFYDEPLPGTEVYFDQPNRQLRNRVGSSTYREVPGGNYDHASHYAYDIQGNVKTLVQDNALLSREFPSGNGCAEGPLTISDPTVADGLYQSELALTTDGNVTVVDGSEVEFRSNTSITLKPGFTAGYNFRAQIAACSTEVGTPPFDLHVKKVEYEYDLFNGLLERIWYQRGQEDQFIHYYRYDADNRLTSISTSRFAEEPGDLIDVDARFFYYPHTPVARVELGDEQVQGRDLAYTINGWLKGVNSTTLFPERDMGGDGLLAGMRSNFGRDAFGFELGYFPGDYDPIEVKPANERFYTDASPPLPTTDYNPLYNGNIWYTAQGNGGFGSSQVQLHAFRYDQLNRLMKSQLLQNPNLANNNWASDAFGNNFATQYTYDENGNITFLQRRDENGNLLDDLLYTYQNGTNRLTHIDDGDATTYEGDLEDQDPNNYQYDAKGRLAGDASEQLTELAWKANDRIKEVTKAGAQIKFYYDAQGRRAMKQDLQRTTYYVRDHNGAILSVYGIENGAVRWEHAPILSNMRLGTFAPNQVMDGQVDSLITQVRGQKQYELTNHLGSVQTLVSDRKVPDAGGFFNADIVQATDYYPFGMAMPTRQVNNQAYDYGFQGMEQDPEFKGVGNSYTTEFRLYDNRVGRWLSPDPLRDSFPAHSPYNFVVNNPNVLIDPTGLCPELAPQFLCDAFDYLFGPDQEEIVEQELEALGNAQERVDLANRELQRARSVLIRLRDEHPRGSTEYTRINEAINGLGRARRTLTRASSALDQLQNLERVRDIIIQARQLPEPSELAGLSRDQRLGVAGRFDTIFENLGGLLESTGIPFVEEIGEFLRRLGEIGLFRTTTGNILHTERRMERMRRDPVMRDVNF